MGKKSADNCIGDNIKRLMHKKGMSSKQICSALGIAASTFSQYLNGTEPRASVLLKIARHLCVPVEELIEPPKSTVTDPVAAVIKSIEGHKYVEIHTGTYRVVISKELPNKE